MKVLVTGGTGFIGTYLIKCLLEKQFTVKCLARRPMEKNCQITSVMADITQMNTLNKVCENIEVIFHLAGYAHAEVKQNKDFAQLHHEINFQGTCNLFETARIANVKQFIYFSSVKAVGEHTGIIDETFAKLPSDAYGLAKRRSEEWLLAQKSATKVTILRPALVYGPKVKGNLAAMIQAIDRKLFLPLPPTAQKRSMISLYDLCQASIMAVNNPNAFEQVFFLTDKQAYTTRDLYLAICMALKGKVPNWYVPYPLFLVLAKTGDLFSFLLQKNLPFNSEKISKLFTSALYDSTKLERELGFRASLCFQQVLPEMIQEYKGHNQ